MFFLLSLVAGLKTEVALLSENHRIEKIGSADKILKAGSLNHIKKTGIYIGNKLIINLLFYCIKTNCNI